MSAAARHASATGAALGAGGAPWGQEALVGRLSATVAARRLPQSLLLHGPPGVGKRLLALWIGRALQCDRAVGAAGRRDGGGAASGATGAGGGGERGRPCDRCRSCRLAARLEHPDIHLHFPMPRPKRAASREKLREAIETLRHERLAELREDIHAKPDEDEVTGLYLAAVENIRARSVQRPGMGERSVFIVEDADRMVPQSASPEAANAFLKLLEEPPSYAYIVLATNRPDALLPTIRSRTAPLRVAPLPSERVARWLAEERGTSPEAARAAARRAEGAPYRALSLLEAPDGDAERVASKALLDAALKGSLPGRCRAAAAYSGWGARGQLLPVLEALRVDLRDLLCVVSGVPEEAFDPPRAQAAARNRRVTEGAALASLEALEEALEGTERNLNPQATVAVLLRRMGAAFA